MIQKIEINGKKYPFKFGMREIYTFSSNEGVEFDEVDQKISMEFDSFLNLFHAASKKGARLTDSDLVLSPVEIEDAIDEDPAVFVKLEKALEKSSVVKELQKQQEELGNVKNQNG